MSDSEAEVIIRFATAFGEYVKAVDPELWKRAREYALDFESQGNGVMLVKVEEENNDNEE
jgi:hypothetical protein